MSMKLDNWAARLDATIEDHKNIPFNYGVSDCIIFAANCVLATTGIDFMSGVRGTYDSYDQAEKIIEYFGGLKKGLDKKLEIVKAFTTTKELAARGDIVLIKTGDKEFAGVWMGHYALVPFPDEGLCRVPGAFVKEVWGIA